MRNRILAVLLVVLAVLSASCGAGNGQGGTGTGAGTGAASAGGATVTDAEGNELEIPADPESVTIASVYAVAVPFVVALGLSDRVAAVNSKSSFWTDNVPALDTAGSIGRGAVDYEKLAKCEAGVLIHRAGDPKTVSGAARVGVPTLVISAEDMDGIMDTLKLIGAYCGADERAAETEKWMAERWARIDEITSQIPESERLSAICFGSQLGRIAGADMLQSWMIEKAGGVVAADEITNNRAWADIGTEKLYAMDPDVIFLTSSTVLEYDENQIASDPVWSRMKAVSSGKVYRIPAKIDSWDLPGIAPVIGTFFMLHSMYPDHFTEKELQKEIDDYYNFMFGKTFDRGYLGY